MSDDLVKRLREDVFYGDERVHKMAKHNPLHQQAADRIGELEAENHLLKTSGIIEVAVRNPNVMEYIRHLEGWAEAAEAALPEQIEWVRELADELILTEVQLGTARALLIEAEVQLEEGRIKTRRNRAALIRKFLEENLIPETDK